MVKKKEVAVAPVEEPAAETLPENVDFEPEGAEPGFFTAPKGGGEVLPGQDVVDEPLISDPAWTDYVLSRLTDDEMFDGNPKTSGLRRIAVELLGSIVENSTHVIQVPTLINGFWATVESKVVIEWKKDTYDGMPSTRIFTGLADVYNGNTKPEYVRFPCSVAETRAEGRALRKALHLQRVVAAEELTDMPVEESGADGHSTPTQHNFIELKCKSCDINLTRFINCGKSTYGAIRDVPYDVAGKMIAKLSAYQRDKKSIPAELLERTK